MCVFSLRRNIVSDGAVVMSSGRLFQSLRPAVANDRSHNCYATRRRTASWLKDDERRRVRDGMSPTLMSCSDRYRGAVPLRAR